jgi:hypothetical protein
MIHTHKVYEMPAEESSMYKPDKADGDDDEDYNESLAQMYDTVLASMDRAKYRQRKTSILHWNKHKDEPKQSDNLSTSTASSDGTISILDHASSDETIAARAALCFSRDEADGVMKQVPTTRTFCIRGKGRRLGFIVRLWRARCGTKSDEAPVYDNNPRLETVQPC